MAGGLKHHLLQPHLDGDTCARGEGASLTAGEGRCWAEDHHAAGMSHRAMSIWWGSVCMCVSVHTCPCVCAHTCMCMVEGSYKEP